jgi:hypothetical protein
MGGRWDYGDDIQVPADPLLGLGHESERLSRRRFPLTASGQVIALLRRE